MTRQALIIGFLISFPYIKEGFAASSPSSPTFLEQVATSSNAYNIAVVLDYFSNTLPASSPLSIAANNLMSLSPDAINYDMLVLTPEIYADIDHLAVFSTQLPIKSLLTQIHAQQTYDYLVHAFRLINTNEMTLLQKEYMTLLGARNSPQNLLEATSRFMAKEVAHEAQNTYRPGPQGLPPEYKLQLGSGSAWMQINHQSVKFMDRAATTGFKSNANDLVVGVDGIFNRRYILGAIASYGSNQANWSNSRGDLDAKDILVGIYGAWEEHETGINLDIYGLVGRHYYRGTRNIVIPGFNTTATHTHWAISLTGGGELGYRFDLPYHIHLTPSLFGTYNWLAEDAYTEQSLVQAFSARVPRHLSRQTQFGFNFEMGILYATPFAILHPNINLGYKALKAIGSFTGFNTQFAGQSPAYLYKQSDHRRNFFTAGFNLSALFEKSFFVTVSYSVMLNGQSRIGEGFLRIGCRW